VNPQNLRVFSFLGVFSLKKSGNCPRKSSSSHQKACFSVCICLLDANKLEMILLVDRIEQGSKQ
jgi:hypothetical protein